MRIGQKKACYVYRLVTENTVEDRLQAILDEKGRIVEAIMDRIAMSGKGLNAEGQALLDEVVH